MATKYAIATGAWTTDATWSTTSGGAADTTKPTAADDVVLNAASGAINVTIDSGAVCRSLDCLGYTGTLTHNAVDLTIGDATAGAGNRALRLAAGMTYTAVSVNSRFYFVSSSATQQTVTTAGKTVAFVSFVGAGSWVLADALTSNSTVALGQGTFATADFAISASIFAPTGSATRTLTLGSSAITLSSTSTAWSAATVTNLTITANTATVTLTGAAAVFTSGAVDYNGMSVVLSGSGAQRLAGTAGYTLNNLTRTGTAVKTDGLTLSVSSVIVTGTFTATGNSATDRLLVYGFTLGTAATITAATTSLTNVDFRDITAAGAAAWTGTSVGNALGNTGITFTTPVTRYAVATGSVSSTAVWSATSGGASGASVPLCHDTIVLNAASGAITVTNDMPRLCADLTCTGFTGTLTWAATEIYGSLALAAGLTVTGAVALTLMGRSSHTITSAGQTWPTAFVLNSVGGTYTLADALTTNRSAAALTVTLGTFTDGGFATTLSGAAGAFAMTAGTLNLTGTHTNSGTTAATPWSVTGGTVNASTMTIVLSGATATDRTFAGGGKTYGTLTDQNTLGGKLTVTGANTFGTINKTATVACTLELPTSSGITVTDNFNSVRGISGALLTLTGDVTKVSGIVSCDYLNISSSDAAGGATFYAGANSTDGGTNTGWIFGAPTGGRPFKGGTATVKESDIEGALVVL